MMRGYGQLERNARDTEDGLAPTLLALSTNSTSKQFLMVKSYLCLAAVLAACAPQRPVVLPTVQLSADTTTQQPSRSIFDTRRDDLFASMDRIDWPGPNRYRSSSGVPGPDYWQQRADYTINASLDTATTEISGAVEIRYTNNSPDTLRYVWVQARPEPLSDGQ